MMREDFTYTMSKIDYNNLTVPELRSMCKKRDLKGLSKLKKLELVTLLLQSDNKHCDGGGDDGDDGEFQPIIKKTRFKILNQLMESKKLIILTKTKDSHGMQILYNSDTNFVFVNIEDRKNKPEHHIVVGVLTPDLNILPLTKQHILQCRELNFEYTLPENISEKDDEKFESDELLSAIKMMCGGDDDDDDTIPNYDELLI